jgi:hypothetical protein
VKRINTAGALVLGALLLLAPDGRGDSPGAPGEALSEWEWNADVNPPPGPAGGLVDFLVTPAVFDRARPDLGDLRLVDAGGRMVPYALRIRREQDEKRPLPAREFNRAAGADRSVGVSLDLGEAPGEHNEIDVTTGGRDFRRRLVLEGSNDEKSWNHLLDKVYLMHFDVGPRVADVHAFTYPVSRFRYLRVHVFPDRSLEADAPEITSVGVFRSVRVRGEDVTLPANLSPREPVRAADGPGSAWTIEFGGNQVPVSRLDVDVADDEFTRPFQLEEVGEENVRRVVAQGEWKRRRGPERRPLEVVFPETMARRLRLVVTDYRNPPLNLLNVRYTAAAREVVFARTASGAPLRLYAGNPNARPPHYDFAASLPAKLDPAPVRGSLGEPAKNPEYRPPPKPWTERWPWLVYVVLGAASLVLLAILLGLARAALDRHDRRPAADVTP